MESLGKVIRGRLSRAYLFWTKETWAAFKEINPDLRGHATCINACDYNWIEQTEKVLAKLSD
jgi:hypothetical protein